tara:strand:- start:16 stop:453 length:438 start_codon:yes stop_codon:yes gene_type:complete
MLHKYHKTYSRAKWLNRGLIITSKEEFEEIYDRYINSTHCEKCGNEYKNTRDKHMDHAHEFDDKWGHFRNVLCRSCNTKRCKIRSTNTSGYPGIHKHLSKSCAQGYIWEFRVNINGKMKFIKSSIDKEELIKFAIQWKIDNNYND